MSAWPTVKHFASWLTLAPHNAITGGKLLHSHTQKSTNRAAQAFRMAAQSAGHSHSALGAFYRRIRAKHGGAKAITATAHKIARIFYHMLKNKQEYNDPGQDYYEPILSG
jgi:transposase